MLSFNTGLSKTVSLSLILIFLFLYSAGANSQGKYVSNKHNEGSHSTLLGGMGFAFNYTSSGNAGFIEFSLSNPASQTSLGNITGKSFYGADFNNFNQLFAIDGGTAGNSSLYRIDTSNGSQTIIGTAAINSGHRMTGLTYDSAAAHWYAVSTDGSSSILYIVNPATGSLVFVGNITGSASVVSISAARNGTIFGVDNSTNKLIKINSLTALPTIVGSLGITLVSYQGLDFDGTTGNLYLASNTPAPQLRTVDTTTGAATLVGNITGTTLVTGLAIQNPASGSAPPENGLCESFNSTAYPPAGWQVIHNGDDFWSWSSTSAYCLGSGSTEYDFYDATPGVEEQLYTNIFSPAAGSSDSLILQEAYATYQTEDDQLEILTSNDTGVTWTHLILLHGGVNGELVTAPPTLDPYTPACSEWHKLKFHLPAGTNRIQFHVISAYGNNMYLDSICIKENPIGITPITGNIPNTYYLSQNYPNPFNPATKINYSLPKSGIVNIKVYDALGRFVKELINESRPAGNYSVSFDGSNLSSGIYFYKIETVDFVQTKKMLLVK